MCDPFRYGQLRLSCSFPISRGKLEFSIDGICKFSKLNGGTVLELISRNAACKDSFSLSRL